MIGGGAKNVSLVCRCTFDMDGVIIDSEPMHIAVEAQILESMGIEPTDELMHSYIGVSSKRMWAELKEIFMLEPSVEFLFTHSRQQKIEKILGSDIEPIEGIPSLLNYLKSSGIRIGLASSSNEKFIRGVLSKFGIIDYFETIVCGDDVKNGKPAPDIFLLAASRMKIAPDKCVVIEDSTHGMTAAKAAGMVCIGYKSPTALSQSYHIADYVVESIHAAKGIIKALAFSSEM